MDAAAYRVALERHGFSQEGVAVALGYSRRAGQRWASGDAKVPGAVAVIMRMFDELPEMVALFTRVAPFPDARKKASGRPVGPLRSPRRV